MDDTFNNLKNGPNFFGVLMNIAAGLIIAAYHTYCILIILSKAPAAQG